MFQLPDKKEFISRISEQRRFIQVILGPRQVGKTTMVTQALADIDIPRIFESADGVAASDSVWISQLWDSARLQMKIKNLQEFLIVIDEIQKIENWSETVKKQWDKDTREGVNIKVVLLGSSRLLIQKGLTESLAGRFETMYMGHWSFTYMYEAFGWNLEQFIYFGGYPGSAPLIENEERWKRYVNDSLIETSISKDILMLTRVDKPALLKRLFELGSLYSGRELSYTKIIGQLQDAGNTTTLANYLRLLSDCGLLGGLEKYAGNVVRKRSSSPKFQVYNNALLSAQSDYTFSEVVANPKEWGRLVESAIGAHLLNNSVRGGYNVYYWREGDNEVDYVLERKGRVVALEVKSGTSAVNKGMEVFAKDFKPEKMLLVGTSGIPLEDFLRLNPAQLF